MFPRYLYSFFLVATLLFSNLGLAVNVHYCGSEIEKVELGYVSEISCSMETHEKACCKEKSETEKEACCKDETIQSKTDEVTVKVFQLQLLADFVSPAIASFQPIVINQVQLPKKINVAFHCQSNAPPLYKLYQQFLFYA